MNKYLLIVLCFLTHLGTYAQSTIEETLTLMDDQSVVNVQEKIYLHTDKASYAAGETLWFKLYATIGIENFLSNYSKIAYIQLVDPTKKIVSEVKLPVTAGISMGDITLADTLPEGSYHLRAYSNWMRNYDEAYFFDRVVHISNARTDNTLTESTLLEQDGQSYYKIQLKTLEGNPITQTRVNYAFNNAEKTIDKGRVTTDDKGLIQIKISDKTRNLPLQLNFENPQKQTVTKHIIPKKVTAKNSIQAFPEGGFLLENALNKIAFKTLKPDGLGIAAQIHLLNDNLDTVGFLETSKLGMGSLSFIAEQGKKYTAHVIFEDNSRSNLELPTIVSSGYSLMINNFNAQRLYAQINLSPDLQNNKPIYFVLHSQGKVFHVSKQNASKNELVFSTAKNEFPTGILTISILNEQLKPIAERAIFNFNPTNDLPIQIAIDQSAPTKRTKINTNISAENPNDSTFYAFLSASVVNLAKIKDSLNLEPNIHSELLLNGDLQGHVESPGYYFPPNESPKLQELDDLLLTQGWRKINFDSITTLDTPKIFPREESLSVTGHVKKLGRKAPAPNATVQLISTNYMDYIDTLADAEGRFIFDKLMFPDSIKFLVQARDDKGKNNVDIIIEPETYPLTLNPKNTAFEKNDINATYAAEMKKVQEYFSELENKGMVNKAFEIEEVVVRRRQNKASPNSHNLNGPGNADQILSAEDLGTCTSLEMCLAGRLTGVTFQGGVPYNTRGNVAMQIVLDGMYIEGDQLGSLNVMDIQSIEVLRSVNYTTIYGSNGAGGLIVITSKTGADARSNFTPKGIITIMPIGISPAKEFYKPVYEIDSDKTFDKDLRTTIHWQPIIVLDQKGNTAFDFYTSDEPGTYRITLEGVDVNGRIGRKIVEFEVK